MADVVVTLCLHAGVAAPDVICCARLGEHSVSDNHAEAIGLLAQADSGSGKHLRTLLNLKTKAGYSHTPVTADDCKRAVRAAEVLIETARRVNAGA